MRMLRVAEKDGAEENGHLAQHSPKMRQDVEDPARQAQYDGSVRKRPAWRSLFAFTDQHHMFVLILALVLSVASGIIIPALAVFLGKIFNLFSDFGSGNLTSHGLVSKVTIDCIGLVGLGSASWILNGSYFMVWLVFGELQAKSVRDKLYANMLEKDLEWFEMHSNGVGALLPRLQTWVIFRY